MTQFYKVHDLQGCSFMDYTWDEDWTGEMIRVHLRDQFRDQNSEESVPDDISLNEMLDIFELEVEAK